MTVQQLQTVTAVMKAICAAVEVTQVGREHYRVIAPLEVIPRLAKARDCMMPPTCKVEFLEHGATRPSAGRESA
ncbi:hypothetical protein [Paraburkholderia sp. BCC1885]|uniref:hypothetical protein n=1 Tax=Paraburkholderia sp. BCC1885 TaxID=2562669 RepID=UPI001183B390|nr:hypothetical protein [Paraburkholderia sp. BCC1885]